MKYGLRFIVWRINGWIYHREHVMARVPSTLVGNGYGGACCTSGEQTVGFCGELNAYYLSLSMQV